MLKTTKRDMVVALSLVLVSVASVIALMYELEKYDYSNPKNVQEQVNVCERNGYSYVRFSKNFNGTVYKVYCVDRWDNNYDTRNMK